MREKMPLDPMPVVDSLIANDARRARDGARCNRTTNFPHSAIPPVSTGFQILAILRDTDGGASNRSCGAAGGKARSSPRALFRNLVMFLMSAIRTAGFRV
jgi:hypothetical protein